MNRPSITYSQGVALYMGAVLGSGILILPGYTANAAGPAAVISWIFLSLLSIPLAYSFARLALRYQDVGGIFTIVKNAFGHTTGALVGWYFFVWQAVGETVVCVTGASYIGAAFGWERDAVWLMAFLFLTVTIVINLFGMKTSGGVSLLFSGLVLLMLVATVIFSLPHVEAAEFTPFAPHGWSAIGTAGVLIFWAFFGWESITHLVPEYKNPQRDVMRSTWMSVLLVGLVYTSLAFVTIGTGTYGGASNDAPLALLMQQSLGVGAGIATAVVACIVCVGTMNVFFASASRLVYALARDGVLPGRLQAMSKRGVPHRALLLLYGTNAVTMGVCYLYGISMDKVMLVPTTLGILVYIIATLACVKLLWDDKIGRWTSILSALFCLAVAPFAEGFLLVPVLVSAACLLYLRVKKGRLTRVTSSF